MQIRGIDFARHTVVVSSGEAEPGPSGLPGSQQGRQGELLARVVGLAGGEATLELNGQRVVVQTHVPLALGERLLLKAEEGADGQIRLSIQGRQAGAEGAGQAPGAGPQGLAPEEALAQLLDELALPSDAKGQAVARALIARDGMLDPQAMRRLMADLRGQAQVSPQEAGAAALLQKASVAVTPQSLALMLQRPQPEGGAQLGPTLQRLQAALQSHLRQNPAPGPAKAQAQELVAVLKGLPLAVPAQAERVAEGLRQWLGRLDPLPRGGAGAPPATRAGAPLPPSPAPAQPAGAPAPAVAGALAAAGLAELGPEPPTAQAGPPAAALAMPEGEAELALLPAKAQAALEKGLLGAGPALPEGKELLARLLAKADGRPVPPDALDAQLKAAASGPERPEGAEARRPARELVPELGKQLEGLAKALGEQAPAPLKQALREALAELRYTQLVNQVPQAPAQAPQATVAFMVPLVAPQLHPEQPVAQLQVHHRPKRPGEPIDPNNLRLWISLPTEHLDTVQVEVVVKEGVVGVHLGLQGPEDRALVMQHVPELEAAVAQLGWPTARFGTRAWQRPEPVRQELSLSGELHHVDRVV